MIEETHPEAAAVLRDAGWAPHDRWGVYTRGPLVMGRAPAGGFYIKNTEMAEDGPDTPDDPVAAARWLVARFAVETVSKPEETPVHEAHEETGAEEGEGGVSNLGDETENASEPGGVPEPGEHDSGADDAADDIIERSDGNAEAGDDPRYAGVLGNGPASEPDFDPESESIEAEILDADFYESTPAIEGADLGAEILDEGQGGAFIFGDNLEQKRTAAIGLVVQAAMHLLPPPIDYSRMSELRNFVMGVSEGRWPANQALGNELDALEAMESRTRAIENARDTKVKFLVIASREQIEAFDPEAGWPA